ncbi:aldehyde dehydrogenase family protein [Amycolatopsis viridis]|uniref:Aldehyde dehydrogenase (NAD+)/betaine-aldehyde dehydrogenase n=1 Tax=Amycolatopsis viridis TaxID=185678 RepID=A0ABX0SSW9_9PSEU|nr:aldehyde dehydrogenase family protein [Amycolatopsis viridis]NIH78470.1 aldehyde dehydrogenase (NAD+)/betaine-aldehyde dehydrogenase [Amycolatopsis viridis]
MQVAGQVAALIGGQHVATDDVITVTDPSTGQPLSTVARCREAEVAQAVTAARRAFRDDWRHRTASDRAEVLRRFATAIREELAELATLESRDTGKPLSQARADVHTTAAYFEFYASTVLALHGEVVQPSAPGTMVLSVREPHGVTGHIIPWNYPMAMMGRTVAPALAAGNCCVVKPAEDAPLTPLRLGDLALEAGLPPGVLNIVPGYGEEAGAALAAHPGLDHLSFTGSGSVGAAVTRAAAAHAVPVTLELGGKSPNIVFADADLDAAVPAVVSSILQNAGQTCSAGSRLLVERRIHAQVIADIADRFAKARLGPGPEDPDVGPLISARQRDGVAGQVAAAADGCRIVTGGSVPADVPGGGFYYSPTLLDEVDPGSAAAQAEIFGPVLAVLPFDQPAEALRLANATQYGLVAGVWTKDVDRALWLAREAEAGCVYVNTFGGGVEVPFGGVKRSGHGREKGFEALASYTRTKSIVLRGKPCG